MKGRYGALHYHNTLGLGLSMPSHQSHPGLGLSLPSHRSHPVLGLSVPSHRSHPGLDLSVNPRGQQLCLPGTFVSGASRGWNRVSSYILQRASSSKPQDEHLSSVKLPRNTRAVLWGTRLIMCRGPLVVPCPHHRELAVRRARL